MMLFFVKFCDNIWNINGGFIKMDIYSKKFEVTLSDVGENNELSNKGILRFLQEIACL